MAYMREWNTSLLIVPFLVWVCYWYFWPSTSSQPTMSGCRENPSNLVDAKLDAIIGALRLQTQQSTELVTKIDTVLGKSNGKEK